jgi:hypothetical protein
VIELERTMDPVRLSVLRAVLTEAEIEHFVFDSGAGNLWTGAIAIRVMVREGDVEFAQHVMEQAGL